MVELEMTSKDIEREAGIRHHKILRDIRVLIEGGSSYSSDVIWSEYVNSRGKYYPLAVISGELLKTLRLKYMYKVRMNSGKVKEPVALTTIEQIKDIELERHYMVAKPCGKRFFIDGYDPINNVAYEIDEEHHKYQQEGDYEREQYIREFLDCEFIRILV